MSVDLTFELELEGMEHQLIAINFEAITRAEVENRLTGTAIDMAIGSMA